MKTTNKIECAAPQRVGRQPLGGAASLIFQWFPNTTNGIHSYKRVYAVIYVKQI
nr:MAG TPA: hypothetical protein [Caudoviricetes sp.]